MRSGHRMENTQFRTLLLAGLVERLEAFGLVGALERATALNDGPSPPGRETSADPEHGADGGIQEQWTRIVKALFDYEPPREIKITGFPCRCPPGKPLLCSLTAACRD